VRERIDADPAARVTLTELAGEVGVSRYQLLTRYWSIPERQIETSVVLANPPLAERDARP
jgi:hypothetical protein